MYRTPRKAFGQDPVEWIEAEFGLRTIGYQAPYMAVTGSIYARKQSREPHTYGLIPDMLSAAFPELTELSRWSSCTDGVPLHYLANARFWWEGYHYVRPRSAREPDMAEAFASTICAGVLEGEDRAWADLLLARPRPEIKLALEVRLPPMQRKYRKLVEQLPEIARKLNAVEI